MHSCALQAQRGCRARGAPASGLLRAMASASMASPTAATPFFGVSDCSRSLSHPEVIIVHEKRRGFLETVIPPGSSVRELLKADSVKVREREFWLFVFFLRKVVCRARAAPEVEHKPRGLNFLSPPKKKKKQTVISVSSPEEAADALASAVSPGNARLAAAVRSDVLFAVAALSAALPAAESLSAKLEVVTGQSCPKWHSDYVGCRCLVTYAGHGTLFAPPEAVLSAEEARKRRRSRGGRRQAAAAAAAAAAARGAGAERAAAPPLGGGIPVDESLVLRAEPFDFLFLKGRASAAAVGAAKEAAAAAEAVARRPPLPRWLLPRGGGGGRASPSRRALLAFGAVHKSPAGASEESPRLVLTVDDACECCG